MEDRTPLTLGQRGRKVFDRALVVLLGGSTLVLYLVAGMPLVALVGLAQVVPLWWRRTHAGWVFAAVSVASVAQLPLLHDPILSQFAFPIAAYSGARWGGRWSQVGVAVVSVCAAVVASYWWTIVWRDPEVWLWQQMTPAAIGCLGFALTGWALGLAGSQRDQFVAALVDRADQARRMAERDVVLAAQDERARIAREMHDVVAHGLSVIVVQADGARYAAAKDPQVAVDTLATVARTGRSSLAEMRRLLGLLRTGESGVRPQPTLADVAHLVEEARAAGSEVAADLPDPWPEVSDGVGLAVYRVVQEALTNVRKHAGRDARVEVAVGVEAGAVTVRVLDDGRGAASDPSEVGHGLVGMRERVGVHGGTVVAGPAPGGGWRVDARIPL